MANQKVIRYFDNEHGWRFGYLIRQGRKWAIVLHPVKGKKKVPLADLDTRDWSAA